jgi:nickel/cobalt transporter (NicO) family protein
VEVSRDRVDVLYVLDQAEIPTFQERGLSAGEVLARKRSEVERGLRLDVDGSAATLRPAGEPRIDFPAGQGGLKVTRVEIPLVARVRDPRRVALRDDTFEGRAGWKAIVAAPGDGTAVRSTAPSGDPTNHLRSYPEDALSSPLDQRRATFAVRPGGGTLEAPESPGAGATTTTSRGSDGLTGVFGDAASGEGVLLLLLLAAFGWGALHALSPGHGKAMVAAYLIGTRGTARHAFALGATVTITHTIGVFALGLVTLLLSQYILPEDLFPWLTLASGLLVVTVGIGVLRSRMRSARAHHHHHGHDHDHDHHHHPPEKVTTKGLIAMGAAAGLIPCPSALVVLLGAIAQHQVALGLLLIVAFSAGLAMTLTGLGLAVVFSRRALSRIRVPAGVAAALPALSAVVIVGVGFVLTAQAVPQLS